ncbi:hypothetical protein Ancab_035819 [Ancistrocladus abbreviatus]
MMDDVTKSHFALPVPLLLSLLADTLSPFPTNISNNNRASEISLHLGWLEPQRQEPQRQEQVEANGKNDMQGQEHEQNGRLQLSKLTTLAGELRFTAPLMPYKTTYVAY